MQEEKRVAVELLYDNGNDVPCPSKPRVCVSYHSFRLQTLLSEPVISEPEALAAMVILSIVNADRTPVSKDGAVLGDAVRDSGDEFCKVERRVRLVTYAEEKHLPIQVLHTANGASGAVRRKRQWSVRDFCGTLPGSRKGKRMIATASSGATPEGVRHHPKVS